MLKSIEKRMQITTNLNIIPLIVKCYYNVLQIKQKLKCVDLCHLNEIKKEKSFNESIVIEII